MWIHSRVGLGSINLIRQSSVFWFRYRFDLQGAKPMLDRACYKDRSVSIGSIMFRFRSESPFLVIEAQPACSYDTYMIHSYLFMHMLSHTCSNDSHTVWARMPAQGTNNKHRNSISIQICVKPTNNKNKVPAQGTRRPRP